MPQPDWLTRTLAPSGLPSRLGRLFARHEELAWAAAAGLLLLTSWLLEIGGRLPWEVARGGYLLVAIIGGRQPVRHLVRGLMRGRLFLDIDFLMVVAAIGAAVVGAWAEGAFLLFLFALANALERYALDRARDAIRALTALVPDTARVLAAGRETVLPIAQVRPGDVVVLRPGERVPVDGTIRSGASSLDQAPITGESIPVDKQVGDEVYAGTLNGEGALEVLVTRAVGDRTLDRVIRLVEESESAKARTEQFTERFERVFVPIVVVLDILLIVVPPLLGVLDWSTALYRGMTVLVAASPCALALGPPAAMLAGIAQAARRGVLIKGGIHLESLALVRAIAFDKTGTLTRGRPEVTALIPASGCDLAELMLVAGSVERRSEHPLAQAVVRRAEADGVPLEPAGDLTAITGRGVTCTFRDEPVWIGSMQMWRREGDLPPVEILEAAATVGAAGQSVMAVRHGTRWLGVIGLSDQPRDSVPTTLATLRSMGLGPLVMLTGDHAGVGHAVARSIGLDDVRADLMPADKVTAIGELLAAHGSVAMVGDGVNDAPALAAATVGIAMGGAGSAAALETADVALIGDDLSRLPFAIGLARRSRTILRQNLVIAAGMMLLLLIAAALGVLDIGPAVIGHEGSTLIVIGNALRILRYEG
ncbi:MAG TPA: heavy metal translocating P-type ATPase [Gemmatimonadales bacterium]|nr:heavy metal translocating P-type ATPase [Gemmatimonadales bacterium]